MNNPEDDNHKLTIKIYNKYENDAISGIYLVHIGYVKDLKTSLFLDEKYYSSTYSNHNIIHYGNTYDIVFLLKQYASTYKYVSKILKLTIFKYIPIKYINKVNNLLKSNSIILNNKVSYNLLIINDLDLAKLKHDYIILSTRYTTAYDIFNQLNYINY